jgi:hypothetical protein
MSQLTIEEVETGLQRLAAEREAAARRARDQAQRESEQSAIAQRVEIERQWSGILARLADVTRRRNASIVLGGLHRATPDEWGALESEFSNVMREKLNLQSRYPYLKG